MEAGGHSYFPSAWDALRIPLSAFEVSQNIAGILSSFPPFTKDDSSKGWQQFYGTDKMNHNQLL